MKLKSIFAMAGFGAGSLGRSIEVGETAFPSWRVKIRKGKW
jgi:hypothetical protein